MPEPCVKKVCKGNVDIPNKELTVAKVTPSTSSTCDVNNCSYLSGGNTIEINPIMDGNAADVHHYFIEIKSEIIEEPQENEDQSPGFTYSAETEGFDNKVKKQNVKSKQLQIQRRGLRRKLINVEDIFKTLIKLFGMTTENIESLRNINVQVCFLIHY